MDFKEPLALLSGLVNEVVFCDSDKRVEKNFRNMCSAGDVPARAPKATFICDRADSALARVPAIDVLFYRRDSDGEGGSRLFVLGDSFLPKILERIPLQGGLIITDGSNSRGGNFKRMTRASGLQKHGFRFSAAHKQPFLSLLELHIIEVTRVEPGQQNDLSD